VRVRRPGPVMPMQVAPGAPQPALTASPRRKACALVDGNKRTAVVTAANVLRPDGDTVRRQRTETLW